MKKPKIHIGIDPDVELSGVAVWDSERKDMDIYKLEFWQSISEIESYLIPVHVYIEAGWLIKKSNWHNKSVQSKVVGEKIAKNVGANHQVGKLFYSYCIKKRIPVTLVKPKGKINNEIFKKITGWKRSSNQEMRDAAMLVYGI